MDEVKTSTSHSIALGQESAPRAQKGLSEYSRVLELHIGIEKFNANQGGKSNELLRI